MRLQNLLWLRLWLLWLPYYVAAYDAPPRLVTVRLFIFSCVFTLYRWAHSAVLVNDALYVYGGKIDQENQFSYTSAPNTNQLLYLSLSTTFSVQSPSWQLLDSSQGPAIAWHTLAAINNSQVLLFGGQPDPNSLPVISTRADSAWILDVSSRTSPAWIQEPESWAEQPIRRIRHSTATAPNGRVFIFGGERADNSHIAFSDHYYLDPVSMTFRSLPTANAPPDLYGHASIILPNGRILVFGGYCTSQARLLSFSTIWVLDVSNMQWTVVETDTSAPPTPRIAFAATHLGGGLILIHGGSGPDLQSCLMDGWILDTTKRLWTWTRVDALSQIGAKRDHFAVTIGGQVIFGFGKHCRSIFLSKHSALIAVAGYSNNTPAPSTIQLYDPSSSTFDTVYHLPTSTVNTTGPTIPPSTTGTPTPSTLPIPTTSEPSSSNRTAIIVGTVFGVLGLILIGLGTAYHIHRRSEAERADRQFMALNDEDGDDNPSPRHIPAVRMHADIPRHGILRSLGPLSAALKIRNGRGAPRRDMLADEDERSFGDWYNERRGDGTAGSSWSLRSILGAGVMRSREPSVGSYGSAPWREKLDPFSDGPTLMRNEERGLIDEATTSRGSRQVNRSSHSYRDPFADPIYEERESFDSTDLYRDYGRGEGHDQPPTSSSIRLVPNVLPLETFLPITRGGHPLSPVSEQTSQGTVSRRSDSSLGQSAIEIALDSSSSGRPRSTSVNSAVNSALAPSSRTLSPKTSSVSRTSSPSLMNSTQPMKRSNSWWLRFAPTGLLDRRPSGASRRMEFRDPNPPPRLSAIEERHSYAEKTSPPGSGGTGEKVLQFMHKSLLSPPSSSQQARRLQDETDVSISSRGVPMKIYGVDRHGKSVSSLKTADSEAIERMAVTMDVVQRITTRSHRGTGSIGSIGGLSLDTHASTHILEREDRISEADGGQNRTEENLIMFASPEEMERSVLTSPQPLDHEPTTVDTTPRSDLTLSPPISTAPQSSSRNVSQRVRAFERRLSVEAPVSPPPTNTRHREERTKKVVEVNYGLARRPDLFITNPDRTSESGDL
jgi:hypothetical protein